MSDYKIKLEDKAAFINRLDKQGIGVDSYEIVDNKLKGYFEFTTNDPVTDEIVKTILKQSTKINQLKEMAKLTKSQLAEIIREELASMKKSKKKQNLDEINWDVVGPALGVTLPAITAAVASLGANIPSAKKQLAAQKGVKPEDISTKEAIRAVAAALAGKMQKDYGGE
jgi:uncharacterized protein YdbL (DUF1318 family)